MSNSSKTIVATGLSSGLGFEALKQLLDSEEPYTIIFGARDANTANKAINKLNFDRLLHNVVALPLELNDLSEVKTFSEQALETLEKLGSEKIDYLLLNAGIMKPANEREPHTSRWCEAAVVNHFSNIENHIEAGSGIDGLPIHTCTKFLQLVGAHWWSRQLQDQCRVVAVSPGMIPHTGLGREAGFSVPADSPLAETIPQGAAQILSGLSRSNFPSDPERIFLTSGGVWLGRSSVARILDRDLQDQWCPSKEELETEAGIAA
ncbi:hypothetical protein E4U57_002266 [Claviceps arundinis]|uniref:Short-chain dehydrogenase n=1 Tax=Claviceps arundinis TaxID=1623583 RepID=A0A9P7ST46_9HYPO|nr:hypothetical protein E4U57_002266 [Claviceps arundinis]KAG5973326.1 hypothetical protein E4U56_005113 [Claviceps arundinis]